MCSQRGLLDGAMPADDSAAAVRVRIRLVESVEGEWLVGAFGADCLPSSEGADAGRGASIVLGSWVKTMRDAVRTKEKVEKAPYAYPRS